MKIYSDAMITRAQLNDIELRQTTQIAQLKIAVVVSFVANIVLTLALKFL